MIQKVVLGRPDRGSATLGREDAPRDRVGLIYGLEEPRPEPPRQRSGKMRKKHPRHHSDAGPDIGWEMITNEG